MPPRAMAPEQVMGRRVDARADLFSFGSLLYEMVTGEAPFQAHSPAAILQQVCRFQPLAAKRAS